MLGVTAVTGPSVWRASDPASAAHALPDDERIQPHHGSPPRASRVANPKPRSRRGIPIVLGAVTALTVGDA
jgi:hypothetical protein